MQSVAEFQNHRRWNHVFRFFFLNSTCMFLFVSPTSLQLLASSVAYGLVALILMTDVTARKCVTLFVGVTPIPPQVRLDHFRCLVFFCVLLLALKVRHQIVSGRMIRMRTECANNVNGNQHGRQQKWHTQYCLNQGGFEWWKYDIYS